MGIGEHSDILETLGGKKNLENKTRRLRDKKETFLKVVQNARNK